ncbi:hypothetical protein EXE49_07250 [Halorubrum sp. ASP121]|uniref:hypothetical protein n=1 Tax=Halorubrum sp. ASP121 TaxID=1855858 RepID=UPI0010F519C2|nr:hypothetical protein [Halorubrum sp. ASP121]TKX50373.1 hypothetical protein EXE49_07250 [Halorubrum sp. ASP121]
MNSTTLAQRPALTAAVGYVCLHVALVFGSVAVADGDTGSLVAAGGLSIVYYLLITAFGMVLLAVTAPSLSRGWWIGGCTTAVALVAMRYVFGTAAGILTIMALFAIVFLPYVVAASILARLLVSRFGGDRLSDLPTHHLTRAGVFVAGVFLVAMVGGSVLAVVAAPPAVPAEDWPADQQLNYIERTDQRDRETGAVIDRRRDYRRAERVLSLLTAGKADAPEEWLDAAIVLHHGTCPEHFELANRLAVAANESAAVTATDWVRLTYDRWQVSMGEPQRYSTQTGTRPVNAACHPPVPAALNVSAPLAGVSNAV